MKNNCFIAGKIDPKLLKKGVGVGGRIPVFIKDFGQDHWSTFLYLESRAVDYGGCINRDHMRCHPLRHPQFVNQANRHAAEMGRPPPLCAPTRLQGNSIENRRQIAEHDDWDCLEDLVAAKLVKIDDGASTVSTLPMVALTPRGWKVASQLRRHKAEGRLLSTFSPI